MPARCAAVRASASWVAIPRVSSSGRAALAIAAGPAASSAGDRGSGRRCRARFSAGGRAHFLTREPCAQRLSLQVLHHEEVGALVVPDVVQRADVRVRKERDGTRLALEPLSHRRAGGFTAEDHFDRDNAVQARVTGAVDLAHAACAKRGDDLVGAEASAGSKDHGALRLRLEAIVVCQIVSGKPEGESAASRSPSSSARNASRSARPATRSPSLEGIPRVRAETMSEPGWGVSTAGAEGARGCAPIACRRPRRGCKDCFRLGSATPVEI